MRNKMKNIRYYLSLFVILMTSVILLSTSYSKESGNLESNSNSREENNKVSQNQ